MSKSICVSRLSGAVITALCLCSLIGCGGGGGGGSESSSSGVIARAQMDYDDPDNSPNFTSLVKVAWSPFSGVSPSKLVEYQIFRDGNLVGATPANITEFTDGLVTKKEFSYHFLPENSSAAALITHRVLSLDRDKTHRYTVQALYTVQTNPVSYRRSLLSAESGAVTPLSPISLYVSPYFNIEGPRVYGRMTVETPGRTGVTDYTVEFSPNADFSGKVGRWRFPHSPTDTLPFSATIDLNKDFGPLDEPIYLYCRIGARNSGDDPGPLESATALHGAGYLYPQSPLHTLISGRPPKPPGS